MTDVIIVDGEELPLRPLEYKLLAIFVEHPQRMFSRTDLLQEVWGVSPETNTRTVDTHIKRLREKLGAAGDYTTAPELGDLFARCVARGLAGDAADLDDAAEVHHRDAVGQQHGLGDRMRHQHHGGPVPSQIR